MTSFNFKIEPCKCGCSEISTKHEININNDPHFSIWMECPQCGAVSKHSYSTMLDAVDGWNKNHKNN